MINKLNIPAVFVHKIGNKTYQINGKLLSINESTDTCTMKFRNNIIEKDIPLSNIMINEGFLDKIKEYGKTIGSYVVKKVKGFIAAVDETTQKIVSWSLCNVANLFLSVNKNSYGNSIFFAPAPELAKMAGVSDYMTIDDALAAAEDRESKEANEYWKRVVARMGTTDEPMVESIKFVNKSYKPLHEAVYDLGNTKLGEGGVEVYGNTVNSKQLKTRLHANFRNQIKGNLGSHASVTPILIWGAPGIGKTAIVKQVIKELSSDVYNSINLNMLYVQLNNSTIESWSLPENTSRKIDGDNLKSFTNTPPSWLPVYQRSSDPNENIKRDEIFATCKFLASDDSGIIRDKSGNVMNYNGGIVFFDEFARVNPKVQKIIMTLANEHKFGENYNLSSKWGFVFAANRSFDEYSEGNDQNPDTYFWVAAQERRFRPFTFVPTKEEWLVWARDINPVTGESNVEQFICDIIENGPEHVWYATIVNGGYDDLLSNPKTDKRAHEVGEGDLTDTLNYYKLKSRRIITPAQWHEQISNEYRSLLQTLFDRNPDGISGEEYYRKLVKSCKVIKTDEDGNKYTDYYGSIFPDVLIDELNKIPDDYWNNIYNEQMGGDDELQPGTKKFTGKRARYNILMAWLDVRIKDEYRDNQPMETSSAPLTKYLREYKTFAKNFTPEVYEYIWQHGTVPTNMQEDDNIKPVDIADFSETEFSKWKQYTPIVKLILSNLWDAYPGDIISDLIDGVKMMSGTPAMSDKELVNKAKKYNKQFTITINGKQIKLLFADYDMTDIESLRSRIAQLENIPAVRLLINYALYCAKIAIQTKQIMYAKDAIKSLTEFCQEQIPQQYYNQITNEANIADALKQYQIDSQVASQKKLLVEQSKSFMANPIFLLKHAFSFDYDQFENK